MLRGC